MTRSFLLIVALGLSACLCTNEDRAARDIIRDECGPPPSSPGRSVAFDGNVATMSLADYVGLQAYMRDVDNYKACVE